MNNVVGSINIQTLFQMILGQLPSRKIAPNPKTNPNPTLTKRQFSSGGNFLDTLQVSGIIAGSVLGRTIAPKENYPPPPAPKLTLTQSKLGSNIVVLLNRDTSINQGCIYYKINHNLLVAKLHAYGFSNDSLKLLYSYLNNRWYRTKINHKFIHGKS